MTSPAAPTSFSLSVLEVRDETPIDRSFAFGIPKDAAAAFRFVPGQFLTVTDPEDSVSPPRRRAYSISSAPEEARDSGRIEVTVRDSGEFGSKFFRWPVGKTLHVIPPRGRFTLDEHVEDDLWLTAGGSGVAPYRGFVRHLRARGHAKPVTLFESSRVPEELPFDAEFSRHARECPWFRYVPTVTRAAPDSPWGGRRGRLDAEALRPYLRDPARTTIYACGPDALVDAMAAAAALLGIPPDRRRREKWG
jgi:ferredoxin-NADP reductase